MTIFKMGNRLSLSYTKSYILSLICVQLLQLLSNILKKRNIVKIKYWQRICF